MELIADVASPEANSYLTVDDAESRLAVRGGFNLESWSPLTSDQKAFRLLMGARIVDSLSYRGIRATKNQNLSFPRLFSGDSLYVEDQDSTPVLFRDWESLVEYAALKDTDPPVIPDDVKNAQVEVTFQIVHSYLLTLEPFDSGESNIVSLGIDVISLSFGNGGGQTSTGFFSKEQLGAISTVKFFLQKYVSPFRGALL
jgi:hypothetical protein